MSARRVRRVAVVVLALLATLEIGTRVVLVARGRSVERYVFPSEDEVNFERHPFLPWAFRPSRECRMTLNDPFRRRTVEMRHRVNALGLRGPETTLDKPAGRVRVVCLGGSTTQCCGPEETTWPRQLESRLRAALARDVEVLNLGVPLYDSSCSLVQLALLGISFAPDLVIVLHGYNDIFFQRSGHARPDGAGFHLGYRRQRGVQDLVPGFLLRNLWSLAVATWRFDEQVLGRESNMIKLVLDPGAARADRYDASVFRRNLRSIHALADRHGAATLFVTFFHFDPRSEDGRLVERNNAVVREVAAELGAPVADAAAQLPHGEPSLVLDPIHLTEAGDARLAELVAQRVLADGVVGAVSRPRDR